jgi:hypothetical protein
MVTGCALCQSRFPERFSAEKYFADRPVRREKFFRKVTQPHGAVVSLRRAAACQKEDFFPSVRGHWRVPG